MSSPAKLYEQLVTAHRPGILFAHTPHVPAKATSEAKRQPRTRLRAITRRLQRQMKARLGARLA